MGYSPIIDASTSHVLSDPADLLVSPIVSTRQSFSYLTSLAEKQGPVVNQTLRIPGPAWQCDKGVYMFYLTSLRQMRRDIVVGSIEQHSQPMSRKMLRSTTASVTLDGERRQRLRKKARFLSPSVCILSDHEPEYCRGRVLYSRN